MRKTVHRGYKLTKDGLGPAEDYRESYDPCEADIRPVSKWWAEGQTVR